MPTRPSPSQVHVNGPLTNLSVAYIQDMGGFVSNRVFPMVMSEKQSDLYFLYDKNDWLADEVTKRQTRHGSRSGHLRDCPLRLSTPMSMAIAGTLPTKCGLTKTTLSTLTATRLSSSTQKAMIHKERDFARTYLASSAPGAVWTYVADGVASGRTAAGSFSPTNASNNNVLRWDVTNSTPIEDIDKAIESVLGGSGLKPNTLTLSLQVFNVLKKPPRHCGAVGSRADHGACRYD